MIFSEQDVFVFTYEDGKTGNIEWYGTWSDEADRCAESLRGFVVLCNSNPPVILANYTPVPALELEAELTDDETDYEPEGGYISWGGIDHMVTMFGGICGSYDEYDDAADALIAECKDVLKHPVYAHTGIPCFFASCVKGHEVRIPLGVVR